MVGAGREHVLHWRDLLGVKLLFAPEILGGNSLERACLKILRFGLAKLDAAEQRERLAGRNDWPGTAMSRMTRAGIRVEISATALASGSTVAVALMRPAIFLRSTAATAMWRAASELTETAMTPSGGVAAWPAPDVRAVAIRAAPSKITAAPPLISIRPS
jgi:hypothetical protein